MRLIALFSTLFLLVFVVVRQLHPSGILFYQGLALAAVAGAGPLAVNARRRVRPGGGAQGRGAVSKDCLLTFLLCYSFMFTVPTTVDRAYSVRMLIELQQTPDGRTGPEVERWFATDFSRHGVKKRIEEQEATGSIVRVGEKYRLTPLGSVLVASFTTVQRVFNCSAERG